MPAAPTIAPIAAHNLTTDLDLTLPELHALLSLAADIKSSPHSFSEALHGRSIALLFEKPSLRTRMTFELATQQLGGDARSSSKAPSARASR